GGSFTVAPAVPFESTRRYIDDTNVLETTFVTDRGSVRVIDALTLPDHRLEPMRELARSIEGLSGTVPMRWSLAPRFDYGTRAPRWDVRCGMPVATWEAEALAVSSWSAGTPVVENGSVLAQFDAAAGSRAMIVLSTAYGEPLVFPARPAVERRLASTQRFWQEWADARGYDGPWRDLVVRSAMVLKLLVFAPSGASVAAPTTSLPEEIGGQRNWDYRYCWIRDSSFLIDALLSLDCHEEARSLFWWFMQATARTEPELRVLYRLDGGLGPSERDLSMRGYRDSRPVRVGNGAVGQTQLDIYGDLVETAWLYSGRLRAIEPDVGAVLGRIADHVCDRWRLPDSGIWEVRNGPFQFTHSKVMCWVTLDRAARLADRGEVKSAHAARWRREAAAIAAFVESECWSHERASYTRSAGSADVDASLLMLPVVGYGDARGPRVNGTIDAVADDLRDGDFVYRYHADDGVPGGEGCFLNCSFWLVHALASAGRVGEAVALMDRLAKRANDVGLYAEEIEPSTGRFLGNFPQALVHLALINAAVAIDDAIGASGSGRKASGPGRMR
ncbi:MAG TPA: glycoside hydrolase family 15 protein, partial [Vicinamibacterales bacterium]|nr:glycoside hydrolase family 15 protein [Vicinamibacterales bacterium]